MEHGPISKWLLEKGFKHNSINSDHLGVETLSIEPSDLIEIVAEPEEKAEKKVKEATVKNKVVINPKISEAIEEIGGEVLEHHQKDADGNTIPHDDVEEGKMYGYKGGGVVKKEVKALSTAARTMKGRSVAKADAIEEGKGKKNCGCGQDPCITYGKQDNKSMKEEKKAKKDYDGDGKVESGSKEHAGVVHNAIQKKK